MPGHISISLQLNLNNFSSREITVCNVCGSQWWDLTGGFLNISLDGCCHKLGKMKCMLTFQKIKSDI